MQKCKVCGATDFYKEDGYFFCKKCQTQNEDIREEVLEIRIDSSTRLRKQKIRSSKSGTSGEIVGWTSWELYNFILIGLTDELITLGATKDIKLTILQLWATYLQKLEVAFFSTTKKSIPKLSRRYNKRDAEIIYGKVKSQRRSRKRKKPGSSASTSMISGYLSDGSSIKNLSKSKKLFIAAEYDRLMQSQASSEGDAVSSFSQSLYSIKSTSDKSSDNEEKIRFNSEAKLEAKKVKELSKKLPRNKRVKYRQTHITTQYKIGPQIITPMKLWAIIYIALRIHDEPIYLSDMLRYAREGHLSYYKLDHLLPVEVNITQNDMNLLLQKTELTHKGMRRLIASMIKFLKVYELVGVCPDIMSLVNRYCQELELPRGVTLYVERFISLSPPKMKFNMKSAYIPSYEGRAMAFIIVVLKVLFCLDGITEYEISKIAEHMNSDSISVEKLTAVKKAASNGYQMLLLGKSSIDAIEAALWWLECDEFFNCGYGSVLNELGEVEMDASIVDGSTFQCGSIEAVSDVEHPISLAKYVLEHFPNSIVVGEGAKKLAKFIDMNWLAKGNMVAPAAYLAFKLGDLDNVEADFDVDDPSYIKTLQESFGTVGCVAWDGYSIGAGTTTGGLNKKLVGRVGDSPLLGCGTYADRYVGCSLTGHGESIIKLGIARSVAEDVEHGHSATEALQKNFDSMLTKFDQTGGGIVLQKNGNWGTYFTGKKMPYALIRNGQITFGAEADEKITEEYCDPNAKVLCGCDAGSVKGVLDSKLFSFREWQRYIECRRTVVGNVHFPTKLKYQQEVHGVSSLYIKFLESVHAKNGDREEPEITNKRHLIPKDLSNAMKQCIANLNCNNMPLSEVNFFAPSLTPFYSYIRHLMQDPFHILPTVLKTDFFLTKVGYITSLDHVQQFAEQCNINLEVIESNLHFVEKIVPQFEQAKMASVNELKNNVRVQDDIIATNQIVKVEDINEYVQRKMPSKVKINLVKEMYYSDTLKSTLDNHDCKIEDEDNFAFNMTTSSGKLLIPNDDDSDNENGEDCIDATLWKPNGSPKTNLYKKYDIQLTKCEEDSVEIIDNEYRRNISTQDINILRKQRASKLARDVKGRFVSKNNMKQVFNMSQSPTLNLLSMEDQDPLAPCKQEMYVKHENFPLKRDLDDIPGEDNDVFNLSNISIFDDSNSQFYTCTKSDEKVSRLFRPFKDYWMYHCLFRCTKSKNFEVFEKLLPVTFRWLLNECAGITEMPVEDLYEEICLVESYHAYVFNRDDSQVKNEHKTDAEIIFNRNAILNKW